MDRELRILVLEDSPADAELLRHELRRGGLFATTRRVETRDAFLRELDEFRPDAILADYTLPAFDGLAALHLVRQRSADIPYIFVSGTIGEERVVQALKSGATDYLVKGQLTRLVPAVLRAVQEAEERAQRRILEEQFRRAQKMEALGQLAGGIAHDFNNLLTVITGFSELVLSRLRADDPLYNEIDEIRKAGERAAALTRQLLAFSRKQIINPRVLDLNSVVANMDKLLRRVIGEDIELVTVLTPDLGRVKADAGQLEQVILNLAVNSRDAMPDGGRLTIETVNVDSGEMYAREHIEGPFVMLAVTDNGSGMDEKTKAQLFQPFFTTKEPGKGTGLGLATVYGIVTQGGGKIRLHSQPGQGTRFEIYLPRVEEEAEVTAPARSAAGPAGAETILVVEDEDAVRGLVCRILRMYGYTVLEARGGDEAIQICQRHDGPIPLLVTDLVMPGMSGKELAERVAELRPGMNVLVLSGYTSNAIDSSGVLERGVAFLQKPFAPDTLVRKVREVLDARREGTGGASRM